MILRLKRFTGQPLVYNAVYILGVNLFPAFIGLAFWGVAGRLYPIAEIGRASAVVSAVAFVAGIAGLGTSMGVIRFLPASTQPRNFLNSVYNLNILSSLVIGLIFLAGLNFWLADLAEVRENGWYFIGFIVFVLATTLGAVVRDTFIARRRASYSLAYTVISNSLRLVFVFFGTRWGASGLVGAAIFAFVVALLISWIGFLPLVEAGYRYKFTLQIPTIKLVVPFSIGNYLANFLVQMPQTVLPMIVFQQLGAQANGYAYIALMLGGVLISPGLALASSAFAEGANDRSGSYVILFRASILGMLLTLFVAAVVVIGAEWILKLFGLEAAAGGVKLLQWLAIASPLIVLNQLYFTYLRLNDKLFRLIAFSSMIAFVTIMISVLLMPVLGIVSCGIGILVSNALILLPVAFNLSLKVIRYKPELPSSLPQSDGTG
jgi:O-antigen/teichoic acid export membrane protein